MIVLRWNAKRQEMTVINGPWPVTLRTVDVRNGKEYYVGRIEPL